MERTDVLLGAGIGAGLMYVLDPRQGPRRRALARDKVVSAIGRADDALEATARDMANRARGVVARSRRLVRGDDHADDVVVAERVRSELGHCTSHPGAIDVSVAEGRVSLRGAILASELDLALRAVERVRGVRGVDHQLKAHDRPDVPALQGGADILQAHWSPTTRVLAGAAGVTLLAQAAARRSVGSGLLGLLGLGIVARAASNRELRRLLGIGSGRHALEGHETGRPADDLAQAESYVH
jgi:hypothetical protein